jgi:hypothetical protein
MASLRVTSGVALALLALSGAARAEAPPQAPDDADVALRLAWLEKVLDREATGTTLWRAGWMAFYGGATILEGALLVTGSTREGRVDAGMSMGKSAVAFTFTLVGPASAAPAARILRRSPAATPAERLARLRLAESYLRAIAAEERDRRGWFPLVGGALLNAGAAWITWATAPGSGGKGWLSLAEGLAVAQLQFHTQPTGAIRAWDAYQRAGAGARLGEPPAVLRWSIRPTAAGMAVRGEF